MKNKLAKNSLAIGVVTLIVTAGLSFSAQAADPVIAKADSSAITGGGLFNILDSKECAVESTGPATTGTATVCGTGLTVSKPAVSSFDQTASTSLDGNKGKSNADAAVAGTGISALTTIDLSKVPGELTDINTGTVLDPILKPLTGAIDAILALLPGAPKLADLLGDIQGLVIAPITKALQDALPVSANIGAVSSRCEVTADTALNTDPKVNGSTVSDINLVVDLGAAGGKITVPIALDTSPNAKLVGEVAPKQLIDGLVAGLTKTLTDSLNGALKPIAGLLTNVQTTIIDPILAQIGPALLKPVGNALSPILDGTVNKQVKGSDGSFEATALELKVLGKTGQLDLARSSCGPNATKAVSSDDTNTQAAADVDTQTDTDTQSDTDQTDTDTQSDTDSQADADAAADSDAQADADVTTTLPGTGAPNLTPFWMLGLGLLLFGATVLVNEKRRFGKL